MNAPFAATTIAHPQPARFSTVEFLEMIEHGIFGRRKVELVDGEIIELPPPGYTHGSMQAKLVALLYGAVAGFGDITVVGETGIEFFEGTLRGCDAALVRYSGDSTMLTPDQVLLAVEIAVSTLADDLGNMASDYARAGVATLWVVDPEACVVHVMCEPAEAGYARRDVVRFGEMLAVPATDRTISIV